MATISVTSDIDVLSKYEELVKSSLGTNSIYIRAKETIEELANNGDLKDVDKAKIISEVVSSITSSLSNSSMSTALQWASNEKDIELKKLELTKQLDLLDQDKLLKVAQENKLKYESIAVQAETIRMYGTPTAVNGVVNSLDNEGKLYRDINILKQQYTNLTKEQDLIESKLNESYAAIHKTVADTYVNYGAWDYVLSNTGLTGVSSNHTGYTTTSDIQKEIAKGQANGYVYNTWANAMTASASLLGTAMAGGYDDIYAAEGEKKRTGNYLMERIDSIASKMHDETLPYQGV